MRRLLPTNVASLAKLGDRTRPANANVASSVVSRETMQQATLDAEVRSQAVKSQLVSRGNQEVVDIVDRLYNPTATANLVAFTVPAGGVAAFRAIGVFYSEPAICMARVLGWRCSWEN